MKIEIEMIPMIPTNLMKLRLDQRSRSRWSRWSSKQSEECWVFFFFFKWIHVYEWILIISNKLIFSVIFFLVSLIFSIISYTISDTKNQLLVSFTNKWRNYSYFNVILNKWCYVLWLVFKLTSFIHMILNKWHKK